MTIQHIRHLFGQGDTFAAIKALQSRMEEGSGRSICSQYGLMNETET